MFRNVFKLIKYKAMMFHLCIEHAEWWWKGK